MNQLEINNLKEVLNLGYPHVKLYYEDLRQIVEVPSIKKVFYKNKRGSIQGFLNGGKTTIWHEFAGGSGYIRFALRMPIEMIEIPVFGKIQKEIDGIWSEPFSFKEIGSPLAIYKHMKFKAFW